MGRRARLPDETWETPVLAQLGEIELDEVTIAAVVGSFGSGPKPVAIDRARVERQMRDLFADHLRIQAIAAPGRRGPVIPRAGYPTTWISTPSAS